MKIPVESVSVMFRLANKVYGYADNLSYILFKYKNCWRYIEIAEFYVVLNVWKSLGNTELNEVWYCMKWIIGLNNGPSTAHNLNSNFYITSI